MKKIGVSVLLIAVLLLSSCAPHTNTPEISGTVKIFTQDTPVLDVSLTTAKTNAEDILIEACQKNKIPYTLNNNMFDNFGGISSTQTDGWILFIDGEVANAGAKFIDINDGFQIEFRYVNYDEVF